MGKRMGLTGLAIVFAVSTSMGCVGEGRDADTGTLDMQLQLAPGITINTVNWTINNTGTGFTRTGSVSVRTSNTIAFQTGAIPAAPEYTISLTATSVDGAFTCSGSAMFRVQPFVVTPVSLVLNCSTAPPGQGTIVVVGTTQVCTNLDSLGASPLETAVNTPISLSATASVGSLTPRFAWTASAGTFDNASSATPTFTCPATPGDVTITVTVSPGSPSCNTVTTQSVVVTCSAINPTFTNVYADIIGVRCIGCHRPGGGGVTVGMLDMSTPGAAYMNLVGIPGQGIGAGTSGVTCASLMPPAVRVVPSDAASSLLFNKVNSKITATLPPCGSPMPLPAAAPGLSASDVDLIARWISAGAMND
jgi:hypothetical protein